MENTTRKVDRKLRTYMQQICRICTAQLDVFKKLRLTIRRCSVKPRVLVLLSALGLNLLPLAASAQELSGEFETIRDALRRQIVELFPRPYEWPTIPIDQKFACGLYNTGTGQASQLWHFLNFRDDGTLQLSIKLDNGQWIGGNGHYTALLNLGLVGYDIAMTYVLGGQTYQTDFSLGNVQRTYGLNMIRYFDAEGELTENNSSSPIEMYCQAYGHGYNSASNYRRFVCPDQVTPAGVYENVFEFNPAVAGQAFRQRDFYPIGSSNAIIERSEVGMYRRSGNDITMDFNTNPNLGLGNFSDFNELNAQLVQNGSQWQLVVNEFPQGENACHEVQP